MSKFNESEKALLTVLGRVSNVMMQGYSYRPNWNSQDDEDEEKELFRDKETRSFIQHKNTVDLLCKVDISECDVELLEIIGFHKYDDEHTEKGQRLMPLWYYEMLYSGKTKECGLDTDTRGGCVHHFVDVKK